MKKIIVMIISICMLPMLGLAKNNNKGLSKWEQNLQKRNIQTIEHIGMLGRIYQNTESAEEKASIGQNIEMEVKHWYDENRMTIMRGKQEEGMKENKAISEITPEEEEQEEQKKMVEEIKAGKIPEEMLKVLPSKDAQRFKQRNEMAERHNKNLKKIKEIRAKNK